MNNNTLIRPEIISLKSNEYSNLYNSTYKSDVEFVLNRPIKVNNNVNIFINLGMFRFTNAFYNIPYDNCILYYKKRVIILGVPQSYGSNISIVVPQGNYNVTSLLSKLNTLQNDILFEYNSSTFKVSASIRSTTTNYEITILSNSRNINKKIGFSDTSDTVITDTAVVTAPNFIDLLSTQNLYITIENLNLSSNGCLNYTNNDLLEHIGVTALQGNSQTYQSLGLFLRCDVKTITSLRVRIFDRYNNYVNFNNTDWYMTLFLTFQYDNLFIAPKYLVNNDNNLNDTNLDKPEN